MKLKSCGYSPPEATLLLFIKKAVCISYTCYICVTANLD